MRRRSARLATRARAHLVRWSPDRLTPQPLQPKPNAAITCGGDRQVRDQIANVRLRRNLELDVRHARSSTVGHASPRMRRTLDCRATLYVRGTHTQRRRRHRRQPYAAAGGDRLRVRLRAASSAGDRGARRRHRHCRPSRRARRRQPDRRLRRLRLRRERIRPRMPNSSGRSERNGGAVATLRAPGESRHRCDRSSNAIVFRPSTSMQSCSLPAKPAAARCIRCSSRARLEHAALRGATARTRRRGSRRGPETYEPLPTAPAVDL